jgi:hypothetical protein
MREDFDGRIGQLRTEQGWTDETLLGLAMSFITDMEMKEDFEAFLEDTAADENGQESEEDDEDLSDEDDDEDGGLKDEGFERLKDEDDDDE